ncbi:hypothetical protein IGI04_030062 [Brassica rapa subsp. trilocularis]|uniref:TF-B3 domain-containing protein n=1 Tax=Brassica rapa subsp. trilocularis TaxID=1813537 RepID=A0ABQ7LTK9_BRACM|nr:hypothetical protein IGI04_030062 [Brassica rapa subsp. trilocularis]
MSLIYNKESDMGRVFRVWHGDWKKNRQQQWFFVLKASDYGFTLYMDSSETYETVEATLREQYLLHETTPLWARTADDTVYNGRLITVMSRRPPLTDVNLMVTMGARPVAESQCILLSEFSVGPNRYVVDGTEDAAAKARYDSLVHGHRIPTSVAVLNEIFGKQDMLIFHRIALEMNHADSNQEMEIINLDDDDEDMLDVQPLQTIPPANGRADPETSHSNQPPSLTAMSATGAPPVMWDVGIDLINYPEFYNNQMNGSFESSDTDFWNGLIEEASNSTAADSVDNIGLPVEVQLSPSTLLLN